MRLLLILRGPQASGRSHFVREQGLLAHHVDYATMLALHGELVQLEDGSICADRNLVMRGRAAFLEILDVKAARGELVVAEIPSMAAPDPLLRDIARIAARHRYRIVLVEFGEPAVAECLTGDALILDAPTFVARGGIGAFEPATVDLSGFDHVVAIGDIHGAARTLKALIGESPRADTAYIFLGDYIDKGPRSARVLRRLARFADHPGTVLITGNHEECLENWVLGRPVAKRSFTETTLPAFTRRGFDRAEAAAFLGATIDGALLHWRGLDILATHGGLVTPPASLLRLSARHLRDGAGSKSFDVDAAWEEGVITGTHPGPDQLIQIHGHRNRRHHPAAAGTGSFNLEGGIDRGGPLRALVISGGSSGAMRMRTIETANRDIAPPADLHIRNGRQKRDMDPRRARSGDPREAA